MKLQHISRRLYIATSFVLAIAATVVGWSQSLSYKIVPEIPLAFWFPLVTLTGSGEFVMVALSLIQFPIFAVAFTIGIRSWPIIRVVAALTLTYAFLVGCSFASVMLG